MTGVTRVTWMTNMSATTELAWITRMSRMSRMTSSLMKKPEKDLILCGIWKIVCTSTKCGSLKKRKKLIP